MQRTLHIALFTFILAVVLFYADVIFYNTARVKMPSQPVSIIYHFGTFRMGRDRGGRGMCVCHWSSGVCAILSATRFNVATRAFRIHAGIHENVENDVFSVPETFSDTRVYLFSRQEKHVCNARRRGNKQREHLMRIKLSLPDAHARSVTPSHRHTHTHSPINSNWLFSHSEYDIGGGREQKKRGKT